MKHDSQLRNSEFRYFPHLSDSMSRLTSSRRTSLSHLATNKSIQYTRATLTLSTALWLRILVTTYNARTFLYRWSWWPFWGKHRVGKFPFLKKPKKIQLRDNRIWDFASRGLNTMARSKSATMHCMMNASIAYCKKRKVWISCFLGDLRPNHQIFWSRKLGSLTLNGTEWRNTPWSSLSYLD